MKTTKEREINTEKKEVFPNQEALTTTNLLQLVTAGAQEAVSEILKKNPELVLNFGHVTDLSYRIFTNITPLQYAIWALDWNMWSMIRQYMPENIIREQIISMSCDSWNEQHGECASWQNLLNALQKVVILCEQSKWDEASICWRKEVGEAQRLLPVHVVNEYCHPTRCFEPCPNFRENNLPRLRTTNIGDWFTARYNNGQLGETFAFFRYTFKEVQYGDGETLVGVWWGEGEVASSEYNACYNLLQTRLQQRGELLYEFL